MEGHQGRWPGASSRALSGLSPGSRPLVSGPVGSLPWNWKIKIEVIGLFWLELFSQVILLGVLRVIIGLGLVVWVVVV